MSTVRKDCYANCKFISVRIGGIFSGCEIMDNEKWDKTSDCKVKLSILQISNKKIVRKNLVSQLK